YVDGGSLADRLDGRPQPPRQAARLIETLARAIHYAHQQGVIHRDLKPANILLQEEWPQKGTKNAKGTEGEDAPPKPPASSGSSPFASFVPFCGQFFPKITDFGLAKPLHGDVSLTKTGIIMGSPSYMAPEQVEGESKEMSPATDV